MKVLAVFETKGIKDGYIPFQSTSNRVFSIARLSESTIEYMQNSIIPMEPGLVFTYVILTNIIHLEDD